VSDVGTRSITKVIEWRSTGETPQLHIVEYAGERWLQSQPLLLVDSAGKMAVGHCLQREQGLPQFETRPCCEGFSDIRWWALVETP
jgi:hypothetical protein